MNKEKNKEDALMKECFGTIPVNENDDFIESYAMKKQCNSCIHRYNCLCTSAASLGIVDDERIEKLLHIVKVNIKREDLEKKIKTKLEEFKIEFKNDPHKCCDEINNFIVNEIMKKGNEDLKELYIKHVKQSYFALKKETERLCLFLKELGIDVE